MRQGSDPSSHEYDPYRSGGYPPPPRQRRWTRLLSYVLVAVVAAGAAVGITLGVSHPAAGSAGTSALPVASAVPSPAAAPPAGAATGGSVQQVVNKVEPGLVVIGTTLQYNSEAAAGTGMVINPDGLMLTNSHVIEDSTSITATRSPPARPTRPPSSATTRRVTSR